MEQNMKKKFFLSWISPSELVSLNCPMKNKILFISSRCGNKQYQDLACK